MLPLPCEGILRDLINIYSRKQRHHAQLFHSLIRRHGLESHSCLGNTMVLMLVSSGNISNGERVLDKLVDRNDYAWDSIINGYIESGNLSRALAVYKRLSGNSYRPRDFTLVSLLKACVKLKDVSTGRNLHDRIRELKLLDSNVFIGTALVDMYAKCGDLDMAQDVFDTLGIRNAASWNALIAGYAQNDLGENALVCYENMEQHCVVPDVFTFSCILKVCSNISAWDMGREIHAELLRTGMLDANIFIRNALVDMYSKSGIIDIANEVFDALQYRDVVTWNALISGFVAHDFVDEALYCFQRMQLEGVSPDDVTLVSSFKACGVAHAVKKGIEIHTGILNSELFSFSLVIGTALLDMYIKCDKVEQAQQLFNQFHVHDVVSWSALIAGYVQNGYSEEAINCFDKMKSLGVSPNTVTFSCMLKACGNVGATHKGIEIHNEMESAGFVYTDQAAGNALVDMYAKFGLLDKAQHVFDQLPKRNVVSWTSLMTGYGQLGRIVDVVERFESMIRDGVMPNSVTFVTVLNACSHAGVTDAGQTYFKAMTQDYGMMPTLEHHTCLLDLLSRAGQVDLAAWMMRGRPSLFSIETCLVLLGACRKWHNVELGRQAFELAIQLGKDKAASYVCMYNIYVETCS